MSPLRARRPPKARRDAGQKKDRDRIDVEAAGRHGRDRQQGQRPGLDRLAAQSPEGLQDHGDDHRFHAVKRRRQIAASCRNEVGPGDGHDHRHGGDDEADAGDDEPRPAGAEVAEIDGHFRRVGAGDQVHGGQQIEEPLGRDPAAAADQFVFHHGDMGGRPAEGRGPQAEKNECHFAQARLRAGRGRFRHAMRRRWIGTGSRIAHGASADRGGRKTARAAGSQILYAPSPLSGIGEASRKTGAPRRAIMTRAAPFSTHCVPRGSTHSPRQRKGLAQAAIYRTCRALVFPLCGAMILVRKVAFRRKRRLLGEETE